MTFLFKVTKLLWDPRQIVAKKHDDLEHRPSCFSATFCGNRKVPKNEHFWTSSALMTGSRRSKNRLKTWFCELNSHFGEKVCPYLLAGIPLMVSTSILSQTVSSERCECDHAIARCNGRKQNNPVTSWQAGPVLRDTASDIVFVVVEDLNLA